MSFGINKNNFALTLEHHLYSHKTVYQLWDYNDSVLLRLTACTISMLDLIFRCRFCKYPIEDLLEFHLQGFKLIRRNLSGEIGFTKNMRWFVCGTQLQQSKIIQSCFQDHKSWILARKLFLQHGVFFVVVPKRANELMKGSRHRWYPSGLS